MPELDGFEATRQIRIREKITDCHTPIIAMTAHAMKGDRERCLNSEMDGYVSKPIDPDVLWHEMGNVLAAQPKRVAATTASEKDATLDGVVDLKQIRNLQSLSPDGSLLRELMAIFREQCPKMLADVRDAISRGHSVDLQKSAHVLKGSLLSLGAVYASNEAQQLEMLGKEGVIDQAAERLDRLAAEIERFDRAIVRCCGNSID
jgi:CheY-like chemotaxis protein